MLLSPSKEQQRQTSRLKPVGKAGHINEKAKPKREEPFGEGRIRMPFRQRSAQAAGAATESGTQRTHTATVAHLDGRIIDRFPDITRARRASYYARLHDPIRGRSTTLSDTFGKAAQPAPEDVRVLVDCSDSQCSAL